MMKTRFLIITILFLVILFLHGCDRDEREMQVLTGEVTELALNSAKIKGKVIDVGAGATQYGHCYSTSPGPDIEDAKTELGTPSPGDFTSVVGSLDPDTKYYVRGYISRGRTIVYGSEINFTTPSAALPVVTTSEATEISKDGAVCGGNVTDQGGTPVTGRGIFWSTGPIASVEEALLVSRKDIGSGSGTFSSPVSGLTAGTTYYARAFATNGGGMSLGNEITFRTLEPPAPVTTAATEITTLSAKLNGQVNTFGFVTLVYFEYGLTQTYGSTIDAVESPVSASGSVSVSATPAGLAPNTSYHYRVVASNTQGEVYGNDISFTTVAESVSDIDGNVYQTVTIGNQVWLAQNLRVRRYQNGDFVGTITPYITDLSGEVAPKYQFSYKDALLEFSAPIQLIINSGGGGYTFQQLVDMGGLSQINANTLISYTAMVGIDGGSVKTVQQISDECSAMADSYEINPYGLYYTWYAATDNRKLCPAGWRIPTDSEVKNLEIYLGMSPAEVDLTGYRGTVEGDQLKEAGTAHWINPNSGTNSTGFTAVPSGIRYYDGSYASFRDAIYWWTESEKDGELVWTRGLTSGSGEMVRYAVGKKNAYSVRCIIDR